MDQSIGKSVVRSFTGNDKENMNDPQVTVGGGESGEKEET